MRKGQIKIIEKAKLNNLSKKQIAELSKENYSLKFLNYMFWYFRRGKILEKGDDFIFDNFFEILKLVNDETNDINNINDLDYQIIDILLLEGESLSFEQKKEFVNYAKQFCKEKSDRNILYMYVSGIIHQLPEDLLWLPIHMHLQKSKAEKEESFLFGAHTTYSKCLEIGCLKDDYLYNKESSFLYHCLKRKFAFLLENDDIKNLETLYNYKRHKWEVDNISDVLLYDSYERYYAINRRKFDEIRREKMRRENPVIKCVIEYCANNMEELIGGTYYVRKWNDEIKKEGLETALRFISPITTNIKNESLIINISGTGFVNITHKQFDEIKAVLKENGIRFIDTQTKKGIEFAISPNGLVFIKTKSKKFIPAPLHTVYYFYHHTCLKEFLNIIFALHVNPFIDDILKDTKDGCLVPCSYNEILLYRNRSEFIKAKFKTSHNIAINWNKININISYLIIFTDHYVKDKKSRSILLASRDTELLTGLYTYSRKQEKIKGFLRNILYKQISKEKLEESYCSLNDTFYDEELTETICDYISMCMEEKVGIDLRIDNAHLLQRKHDEVMMLNYEKITKNVKISKNTKFKPLYKALTKEFEPIKSKKRLIKETAMQHHCVWSYADNITNDISAIFSYMDHAGEYSKTGKSERYTIEIRYGKEEGFYVNQIKSKYNKDCKREFWEYVQHFLDEVNKKKAA